MENSGDNVRIIRKLEPIDQVDYQPGVVSEVIEEIHIESNTDGNLQINTFTEEADAPNPGEYVTEDRSQKIIITEAGEAYISEGTDDADIYVVDQDGFDANCKAEYTIVSESDAEAEGEEFEEEAAMEDNSEQNDPDDPDYPGENEDDDEENTCTLCDRTFKTEASLKRHISVTHNAEKDDPNDPLAFEVCGCCGEPADSAHTSGSIKCKQCDKLFVMQANLIRHSALEHPDDIGMYRCCECTRSFSSKKTILQHMQTHPLAKPFHCERCNRDFARKYHLERHVAQCGCDGKPRAQFKCEVCNKKFGRKDNLRDHLRGHAGQIKKKKTFTCSTCGKVFQGQALLLVHQRSHTGEKPYGCDLCEKKFPSSGAMKKHRRMHTGEKPYQCMQCKRRFAAKETLNRHVRTHTGVKPHSCSYCGKCFIQAAQLRAHIFHHTGENAFTCPHCNRAFNRRVRLTTHIKFVHEGANPLECDRCDRTFFRKEDLIRHGVLHSGEKPFSCDVCKKKFAVKASLKVHALTHRKEQPCACDECGRAFIRQDCLLRHMRSKHRDVLEDIMAAAEMKRLQEQLLNAASQPAAKANVVGSHIWNELTLTDSIKELLSLLVDLNTLKSFGWPDAPVDKILDAVIRRCGHDPASDAEFDYIGRMRENAKLLFTVVIDDQAVKALLNNQTVDEVIQHVLRLARTDEDDDDDDEATPDADQDDDDDAEDADEPGVETIKFEYGDDQDSEGRDDMVVETDAAVNAVEAMH